MGKHLVKVRIARISVNGKHHYPWHSKWDGEAEFSATAGMIVKVGKKRIYKLG